MKYNITDICYIAIIIIIGIAWAAIAFDYAHYQDTQALSDNTTQQ